MNKSFKTGRGVYSDREIEAALASGQIVCQPFEPQNLSAASLDVTLGEFYYRTESSRTSEFYNPFDEQAVADYFNGPHQAELHSAWAERSGRQLFEGIDPDCSIIVLGPKERILAHTQEFVGIRWGGASTLKARSTWGRNGLAVCFDAGWGDPGYINRWTLELYNLNQQHSLVLPVGERIAQLVFFYTLEVGVEYNQRGGKYQSLTSDELDKLMSSWQPQSMLPKAYRDRRSTKA